MAALTVTGLDARPAGSQGGELPAVTASPVDEGAPNGGQCFTVDAERGETIELTAEIVNPAPEPQSVSLYLADLSVRDETAEVGARGEGVGGWGGFDEPTLVVPAGGVARASIRLTVPEDAEPGDHLGAVVAESQPSESTAGVMVVKRVASRLYVTVPGDAEAGLEIRSIDAEVRGGVVPRRATVTVQVRNTGDVRLDTRVVVDGKNAEGSPVVMSRSTERYVVEVPVSILGGPTRIPVEVTSTTNAGAGPAAEGAARLFVVPWWILLAFFLAVVGYLTVRELRRRLA